MSRMWKKICPVCGTAFETGLKYTKYCPKHRGFKVRRSPGKGKPQKPVYESKTQGTTSSRACHDCGRRTTDYRCPACQKAFRQRHGVAKDTDYGEDFLYA